MRLNKFQNISVESSISGGGEDGECSAGSFSFKAMYDIFFLRPESSPRSYTSSEYLRFNYITFKTYIHIKSI